jgi:hypothetical protein
VSGHLLEVHYSIDSQSAMDGRTVLSEFRLCCDDQLLANLAGLFFKLGDFWPVPGLTTSDSINF